MKKKLVITIIEIIVTIVIIVIFSIFAFKIISYKLEVSKNEKILLNYYSLKSVNGMTEDSIKDVEFYKNDIPQEYNITKLVNYYLLQLENIKEGKVSEKDTNNQLYINDNKYYEMYSKDYTGYDIEEEISINYVIAELERVFTYKENEWFISVNANEKYDLPYGYYLTYDKSKLEKLNKANKVCKVHLVDRFVLRKNQEDINPQTYNLNIVYIDNNGVEKSEHGVATYNYDTQLWDTSLHNLYYKNTKKAKITLHNHIYDRESEEKLRIENEEVAQAQRSLREYENKLEEEENGYRVETKSVFDGAGLIVRYDYFREKRWKYRFNKERSLKGKDIVETIELNEGKHGFELPYTDEMTIDEAVERFLNDREQVKKALALWNIDLDKIKEEDIIEKINEVTFNY